MADKIYFKVKGRVQGVGYRWFVKDAAERHKLRGWVKNLKDGSVEGKAAGDEDSLNTFLKEIRTEHPAATVREIAINAIDEVLEEDFYIKH
ncbi:MAG: acylphosphatase [Elusimicrobia bacterium CG08_land_8_20_14_0_20_51_18]|nr:MAG: acylphosphatase [Elusimicrobia bacterium CG08_land_8_20_14_0_20_51_18]